MKRKLTPIIIGIAGLALPMSAHAATVTWGSVAAITGAGDIDSSGLDFIVGANFSGTTTLVNNGTADINFLNVNPGASTLVGSGITIGASSDWVNWGTSGSNSSIAGTFGTVLDSNIGIEIPGGPTSATITLSGLNSGTTYRVQFFADSTGNNTQSISGSGSMNSLSGQFVTGTFTADGLAQVLDVSFTSGDFGVANALTIGAVPVPEPSAALLGGLGLLGLLRRRRD
ncbi:MAG: PEP-CTERM sorting domain-containing protein [Akkermansiaceae bacterium]|nr:PEP-CTERM sorting domain-containing protein [Akkermansiaceae bacterium]MCF7731049.1 PEP-CTERM sorting domain-containing protein [Akkermansiaceae bacterium]